MANIRIAAAAAALMSATVLVAGCGFGGDTTTVTVTSPSGSGALTPDTTSTTPLTGTVSTGTTSTVVATTTVTVAATTSTPATPVLNPAQQATMSLQKDLTTLGFYSGPISGVYGPATNAAVSRFQKAAQLPVDGIAGPQTMAAVNLALGNPNTDAVNLLQTALTGLCYFDGSVDGVFGSHTEAALRAFQKQAGITVDGRYGPATATALAKAWPDRPASCSNSGSSTGNSTGDTATLGSPALQRTFDLSSCTATRGTIEATGASGSVNLGIDTEGGSGAQVVVKGGGYGLQGNISKVTISSNGQFRLSGAWGNNNQAFTMVGTCQ